MHKKSQPAHVVSCREQQELLIVEASLKIILTLTKEAIVYFVIAQAGVKLWVKFHSL